MSDRRLASISLDDVTAKVARRKTPDFPTGLRVGREFSGEWFSCATEHPDEDVTVLLGFAPGNCELGFLDAGEWKEESGGRKIERPLFWAHLPAVPEERGVTI